MYSLVFLQVFDVYWFLKLLMSMDYKPIRVINVLYGLTMDSF